MAKIAAKDASPGVIFRKGKKMRGILKGFGGRRRPEIKKGDQLSLHFYSGQQLMAF